jgi:hypothetical protein
MDMEYEVMKDSFYWELEGKLRKNFSSETN